MSNSNSNSTASINIGLGGILFVVFLVLKLVGVIDWSWWWVTAPLWIPAAVVLILWIIGAIIIGIATALDKRKDFPSGRR